MSLTLVSRFTAHDIRWAGVALPQSKMRAYGSLRDDDGIVDRVVVERRLHLGMTPPMSQRERLAIIAQGTSEGFTTDTLADIVEMEPRSVERVRNEYGIPSAMDVAA